MIGTGIEMDPAFMFGTTMTKLAPKLEEIVKLSSLAEVEDLKAPRLGVRKKTNNYALLTPALGEACQHTDMTSVALLITVVK